MHSENLYFHDACRTSNFWETLLTEMSAIPNAMHGGQTNNYTMLVAFTIVTVYKLSSVQLISV